ncbi:hypothetical protein EMA8858_00330 [Emticicia aquatica]|uniref:ATPase dynein-related AAA domain-containing protein n=1 Tax=Emticicia aquatica TaxID=1681835 RepID=A0ABM9AL09_9BACT|nr:hypothetical protein [Emticicia aquatica]CAH0994221.1 hypothetical protein EMA8858_00330 [Emticicia aquatica]
MAAPYWKTDRVKNVNTTNLIDLITFLKKYDGGKYSDLTQNAIIHYGKQSNPAYFGQIVTQMNILGLFTLNDNGTFNVSKIANMIFNDNKLANSFLDYVLLKFQYPRPHIGSTNNYSKPYFLILSILIELYKINPNEAYFTQEEFYYLFDNNITSLSRVNNLLINQILADRVSGVKKANVNNLSGIISYDKAFFSNSCILSSNSNYYPKAKDFFIGLYPNKDISFVQFICNHYCDGFFVYSTNNNDSKNGWANYLHNVNDFFNYINQKNMLQDKGAFLQYCINKGFYFDESLIRRFLTSLTTKPFLLLTGISGTGKSKIAELYGEFLLKNSKGAFLLKAVGSNWNDNKNLLGYYNPIISSGNYNETDVVKFIQEANSNPTRLYIILLDEMNLSYTERYFSDFLSALESISKEITLPDGKGSNVKWSENLKIIGTINEDETTHTLSPKVIDRANLIEMNGIKPSKYIEDLILRNDIKTKNLNTKTWKDNYIILLDEIYNAFDGKFGFRVIDEITSYILINTDLTSNDFIVFLDEQVYQKLLPKLHGTRGELLVKLEKLKEIFDKPEFTSVYSKTKIASMINQIKTTGFTSFVTA